MQRPPPFDPARLAALHRRAARLGGAVRWCPRGDGGLLVLEVPGRRLCGVDIDELAGHLGELERVARLPRLRRAAETAA